MTLKIKQIWFSQHIKHFFPIEEFHGSSEIKAIQESCFWEAMFVILSSPLDKEGLTVWLNYWMYTEQLSQIQLKFVELSMGKY